MARGFFGTCPPDFAAALPKGPTHEALTGGASVTFLTPGSGRAGAREAGLVLGMARFLAVLARLKITDGGRNTACTALYRFGGAWATEWGWVVGGFPRPGGAATAGRGGRA